MAALPDTGSSSSRRTERPRNIALDDRAGERRAYPERKVLANIRQKPGPVGQFERVP